MSSAARKQLWIQAEVIRNIDKHEVLCTHDLHIGQSVLYQDSVTKAKASRCHSQLMSRKEKLQDNNKWWCWVQKDSSMSQALYTRRQELTINTVGITTSGTVRSHAGSETTDGHNLTTRSLHKWTIDHKYIQADLKGTLSPLLSLIYKYFMFTLCIWIYILCISV